MRMLEEQPTRSKSNDMNSTLSTCFRLSGATGDCAAILMLCRFSRFSMTVFPYSVQKHYLLYHPDKGTGKQHHSGQ